MASETALVCGFGDSIAITTTIATTTLPRVAGDVFSRYHEIRYLGWVMKILRMIWLTTGLFLLMGFGGLHAETHIRITPMLTVSQSYEDNIDLEKTNTKSDYIVVVSPGIKLLASTKKSRLNVDYAPGFVYYAKYNEYNTVRQRANLDYFYRFSKNVQFNLRDQYYRTEDFFELPQNATARDLRIRNGRNSVDSNDGVASLDYIFGQENHLTGGYRYRLLRNQDPRYNDADEYGPFAALDYWFNKRHGIRLGYRYVRGTYDSGEAIPLTVNTDDYAGHRMDAQYSLRFNPHTSWNARYGYSTRRFDRISFEDYNVHEAATGIDHAFSRRISLSLEGGYLWKERDNPPHETVESYLVNASWNQRFEHGNLVLGVQHGWDDGLLEDEVRGFTRYWAFQGRVSRQLSQRIEAYIGSLVRSNDYEIRDDDTFYQAGIGITARLRQWLYMSLGYDHRRVVSDNADNEYRDNRVFLVLSAEAAQPFVFGTKAHGNMP
ncbi:outer membrane beta-barrel protein [Desulfatirhabdium butyrativorans]|uniref:outer membrane beta-barrel protein n=1 Tax=Desulfatirhabdium butyrativorans TaxID=340467 RepID=UPI00146FC6A6|nr:outer membrane beta-barrel protein [Desulfatirhabdium butyrativorans]